MSKKTAKNPKKSLRSKEYFFNRELSWLEFNDRVLREGCNETIPLLERLKYLAIVSSNLDEFFMVRVAGLMQRRTAQIDTLDPAGMSPATQLAKISLRAHRLVAEQTVAVQEVLTQLALEGLVVLSPKCWTQEQKTELSRLFDETIAPVVTPIAMDELPEMPLLSNLRIYVGLLLEKKNDDGERIEVVAVVPVPQCLARFYPVSLHQEGMPDPCEAIVAVEDVLLANAEKLFPGQKILDRALFRITRDGNVAINDDDAVDLCETIHTAVSSRRRRAAVRLEISTDTVFSNSSNPNSQNPISTSSASTGASPRVLQWLLTKFGLHEDDCYCIDGLLDASAFFEIAGRDGYERLRYETWVPQIPRDMPDDTDLWEVLRERDVLLSLPYESFDPVVRMVRRAAEDPDVLAIKQTLYRTSGDSPIVHALELAASRGKEVTVLVELKARFDEARNVVWARRLEDAGCHVLYGVAGLKTHAKALLIVRSEHGRMRRYVHLATGNYNDKTAKLYSDLGLMTTDRELTADVAAFFNLLTGYSDAIGWERVTCEPVFLKQKFVALIDREAEVSTPDRPGRILAKMNSLEDPGIIAALYRASCAGVRISLNIRGICCLRPGIPGVSENIEVRSIVDRYLEHSRIFFFGNAGHEELYLASSDWMVRNLEKRFEMLFPIIDPSIRKRILGMLKIYFDDNVKARVLQSDGSWLPVASVGPSCADQMIAEMSAEMTTNRMETLSDVPDTTMDPTLTKLMESVPPLAASGVNAPIPIRAQERLYQEAVEAAQQIRQTRPRFQPLHSKET